MLVLIAQQANWKSACSLQSFSRKKKERRKVRQKCPNTESKRGGLNVYLLSFTSFCLLISPLCAASERPHLSLNPCRLQKSELTNKRWLLLDETPDGLWLKIFVFKICSFRPSQQRLGHFTTCQSCEADVGLDEPVLAFENGRTRTIWVPVTDPSIK